MRVHDFPFPVRYRPRYSNARSNIITHRGSGFPIPQVPRAIGLPVDLRRVQPLGHPVRFRLAIRYTVSTEDAGSKETIGSNAATAIRDWTGVYTVVTLRPR